VQSSPIALITDVDWEGSSLERDIIESQGFQVVLAPDSSEETLVALAADASVILVCFASLTPRIIEAAVQAQGIIRYGGGTNNIDRAAAERINIPVFSVPDFCVEEVADHALLLMLALNRNFDQQVTTVRSGGWAMPGELPVRLSTQSVGLVGMGRTGQAFARRVQALGMDVFYTMSSRELPKDIAATRVDDILSLASRVDVLSLHLPLTSRTQAMIDSTVLGAMKPSAMLLNVARGGLVNTDDLVEALRDGGIAHAGLDVTDPEPLPPHHPLRSLPQCLVTPHFAYRSREAIEEVRQRVARAALALLQGKSPSRDDVTRVD
jgi:D-3-phosphoglycerate dehydrogenase / 2-oxoglutarate reductase